MNEPTPRAGPDVQTLFTLFLAANEVPQYEIVPAAAVPSPYRELLVHEQHMTVTVEKYHGDSVDIKVLSWRETEEYYARNTLLVLHGSGKVVQFNVMRIDFHFCSTAVRDAIRARQEPLGRILINHNVLRRIEPKMYFRVTPGPLMMRCFGIDKPQPTYGRLGIIYCDEQPAVEVLEIVRPE